MVRVVVDHLRRKRAPEKNISPRVLNTIFYYTTANNIIITNKLDFKNKRARLLFIIKCVNGVVVVCLLLLWHPTYNLTKFNNTLF